MIKKSFLLFISLYIVVNLIAQCPDKPGMPVLKDQTAVDSFLAIYPNCTNYHVGYIAIDNKPVTWLYEDVRGYLLALSGILIVILFLLSQLFKRVRYFRK